MWISYPRSPCIGVVFLNVKTKGFLTATFRRTWRLYIPYQDMNRCQLGDCVISVATSIQTDRRLLHIKSMCKKWSQVRRQLREHSVNPINARDAKRGEKNCYEPFCRTALMRLSKLLNERYGIGSSQLEFQVGSRVLDNHRRADQQTGHVWYTWYNVHSSTVCRRFTRYFVKWILYIRKYTDTIIDAVVIFRRYMKHAAGLVDRSCTPRPTRTTSGNKTTHSNTNRPVTIYPAVSAAEASSCHGPVSFLSARPLTCQQQDWLPDTRRFTTAAAAGRKAACLVTDLVEVRRHRHPVAVPPHCRRPISATVGRRHFL